METKLLLTVYICLFAMILLNIIIIWLFYIGSAAFRLIRQENQMILSHYEDLNQLQNKSGNWNKLTQNKSKWKNQIINPLLNVQNQLIQLNIYLKEEEKSKDQYKITMDSLKKTFKSINKYFKGWKSL